MADGYTQLYDTQDMQEMTVDGMAKAGITTIDFIPIYVTIIVVWLAFLIIVGFVIKNRKRLFNS